MSRTNERLSEPGVRPSALPKRSARIPKTVAVSTWPTILDVLLRPRLRARRSLMKSSRKPTTPSAVVEEQHEHRRRADLLAGDDVRQQVAQPDRDHDRDPAHRGRAALGLVALRALGADLLAEALPGEEADEVRREQDGDRQCDPGGDEDAPHAAPSRRSAAIRSSPAAREAFTRTTSPGASSAASSAVAAAASATGRPAPYSGLSTVTSSSTPSSLASSATLRVGGRGLAAQLAHRPEHGPGAPAAAQRGEGAQGGGHRVGVGVVGVVDDGDAVGAVGHLHPPPGRGRGRRERRRHGLGAPPSSPATAAAASALPTWWAPTSRSATGALPAGVTRRNTGAAARRG